MQKNSLYALLVFVVLLLSISIMPFARSQSTANSININADGSIEPQTAPIQRNGDIYTLVGNISGGIAVYKSNIVIDGAGYALNGDGGTGIDLTGNLTEYPSPNEVRNVTIKNLGIINFNYSINARGSSQNSFYNDYIANTTNGFQGSILLYWNSGGNNITHCTIVGNPYAIAIELSSSNIITENNLFGGILLQLNNNETVDRNYWSDYLTRYPNATEIDSSGVGNTAYSLEIYANGEVTGTLQDNHALICPMTVSNFPAISPSPSVPEFSWLTTLPLLLAFPVVIAVIRKRVSSHPNKYRNLRSFKKN